MASAQVVETSVPNNSPSQDSNHPDDLFQSRYVTPGFKPFSSYYLKWKEKALTCLCLCSVLEHIPSRRKMRSLNYHGDQVSLTRH